VRLRLISASGTMAKQSRRIAWVITALALLGGAALLGQSLRARLFDSVRSEASWQARQFLQSVQNDLRLKLRETEARVMAGASLNPVRALVAHGLDRTTVENTFKTEDWWRASRDEFPVQLLIIRGSEIDFGRESASSLAVEPLIAAAKRSSPSSQILISDGKPYLAAAAIIDIPAAAQPRPAFLILAKPLEPKDLATVWSPGGAALFSFDRAASFGVGPTAHLSHLHDLINQDASNPIVGPDADWAAASGELAPKLRVWVHLNVPEKSQELSRSVWNVLGAVWAIAAILACGCLYLAFGSGAREISSKAVQRWKRQAHGREDSAAIFKPPPQPSQRITHLTPAAHAPVPATALPSAATAIAHEPIGKQFGRYLLLHRLREGSSLRSDVAVLCGAEGFSRLLVIKRLHPELAREPEAVAEFVDAARRSASLVHSNLVPIYELGQTGDEYFFAEEHILGRDLETVIGRTQERDGQALSPLLVFFIGQEVLKALAYAHARRDARGEAFVHGHISPRRILISAAGEVKLLDFGIPYARAALARAPAQKTLFFSPEQARGEPMDPRSDLFSLAMTMFWCLTGRPLYSAKTLEELTRKIRTGPGREERDLIHELAGPAHFILQRALKPFAEERFRTAEEFARAIPPWDISRAGDRLQSLMRRLFEEDFRDEQRQYSQSQVGAPALANGPSPLSSENEDGRVGQS